jgi:hypothetical protein
MVEEVGLGRTRSWGVGLGYSGLGKEMRVKLAFSTSRWMAEGVWRTVEGHVCKNNCILAITELASLGQKMGLGPCR